MPPAESPATEALPARPAVWPVFVTFAAVYLSLNAASLLVLALGLRHEAAKGTLDLTRLDAELFRGVTQELLRSPLLASLMYASAAILFVLFALAGTWFSGEPLTQRMRLHRTPLVALLFATFGVFAVSDLLETLVVSQNWMRFSHTLPQIRFAIWQMDGRWLPTALLLFAVLPGVAEELFFRGFVQTRLTQRWGAVWGVLVSALLFGLAHSDAVHTPVAFALGLLMGIVVQWTGSLWPAIVAHVVNNALSVLTTLGHVQFNLPAHWKVGAMGVLAVTALLLLSPEREDESEDISTVGPPA